MNAFAKHLASGLDIRRRHQVSSIRTSGSRWAIGGDGFSSCFDQLVSTAPAPQTMALLTPEHRIQRVLEPVRFDPCLTLMAAVSQAERPQFDATADRDDTIAWLARDSSKPGRVGTDCWIAQAGPAWSAAHLDLEISDIEQRLLRLLCDRLGVSVTNVTYSQAFRWRYARVARPLGQPFARDEAGTLYAGGDWTTDARAEAAWLSGSAIAEDLIAAL
jgi:predicted NAD/FAD-dependent oxidoreductase